MVCDFQRSRVYYSENEVFKDYSLVTIDKLILYFASIISSDIFIEKFGHPIIFLEFYARKYSMFDYKKRTIFISAQQQMEPTILHELSHAVCKIYKQPLHGKEFCKRYLWFIYNFLEIKYYYSLEKSFQDNKVIF